MRRPSIWFTYVIAIFALGMVQSDAPLARAQQSRNTTIQSSLLATLSAEATESGNLWVQFPLHGQPGWFLLDTASQGISVDSDFARRAGLSVQGGARATGSSSQTIAAGIAHSDMVLPDCHTQDCELRGPIVVLPLRSLESVEGHAFDGILGSAFFSHFVVELDYAEGKVRVYELAGYHYRGHGARVPIRVDPHGFPTVRVGVEMAPGSGAENEFLVDSGASRSTLDLFGAFTREHGLAPASLPTLDESGTGLGATLPLRIARAVEIRLGPFRFPHPFVALVPDSEGVQTVKTGLIGSELLRRFTVVLDYANRQMFLEPNAHFNDPFAYDASGLRLHAEGPALRRFVVARILLRSPAEDAGLKAGDEILAIDGQPAGTFSLDQIRAMFREAGRIWHLRVKRGDKILSVALPLRQLI